MYGIVPLGASAPTFDDDEVKRQIAADASFSSKLAAVGVVFQDALKAEPESKYVAATSSASSSSFSYNSAADASDESATLQAATSDPTPTEKRRKPGRFRVSPATILNNLLRASVRPGTWIYVSDTAGRLYVGIKSSGTFQHASFLSGARLSSAGVIGIDHGQLTYLSPLSGHYRPTTKSFRQFITNLQAQRVDTSNLKVSKAYNVLLGMEFYSSSKKATRHLLHPERKAEGRQTRKAVALSTSGGSSATHTIEEHDKHGLAKLMDGLKIPRESRKSEIRRETRNSNGMG